MLSSFGFLGCGQMGGALLRGWLAAGQLRPEAVQVADPVTGPGLAGALGVQVCGAQAMLDAAEVVLLAVKPQAVAAVVAELRFRPSQLVISVAAGLTAAQVAARCAPARVVRVMPNMACQVGAGVTLVATAGVAPADLAVVEGLFAAVGHVEPLADEGLFHAGTALSGSGPAYLFVAMEALADGAVAAGLPRAAALRLAAHTVAGAGALAVADGAHPAVLKDRVASPAGTTIQALRALEDRGLRGALMAAVEAAVARSRGLEGQ